jgi:hypothetical protein
VCDNNVATEFTCGLLAIQLAVLATYVDAELLAVYHYCRSILVEEPFVSSLDNLASLFEKNAEAIRRDPTGNAGAIVGNPDKMRRSGSLTAKKFMANYVHLQGILFKWTRECQSYRWNLVTSPRSPPEQINVDEFVESLHSLLEEYDQLLANSAVSEQLLIKLLVIGIFGVHFSSAAGISSAYEPSTHDSARKSTKPGGDHEDAEEGHGSSSTGSANFFNHTSPEAIANIAAKAHFHTTAESLALLVVFGLTTRTASRVRALMTEEKARKSTTRLIPVLSIFAEWIAFYPAYLVAAPILEESNKPLHDKIGSDKWLYASLEALRTESRARSSMRSAFANLKTLYASYNSIAKAAEATGAAFKDDSKLREHVDLRGFYPLAEQCEVSRHSLLAIWIVIIVSDSCVSLCSCIARTFLSPPAT